MVACPRNQRPEQAFCGPVNHVSRVREHRVLNAAQYAHQATLRVRSDLSTIDSACRVL